jgi:AraC family transcriptional regulator
MTVQDGWFGQRLAATHNLDAAPTLILKGCRKAAVAVTRMRSSTGLAEASKPLAADKALSVHLQLQELKEHEVWIERKRVYTKPYPKGAVTIIDLQKPSFAYLPKPFDALNFYVPMAALNEYGHSEGLPRVDVVDCSFGEADPVIENLGSALLPFLDKEELASRLLLDQAHQALCAHLIERCTGARATAPNVRGGLAARQRRRAEELLRARLLGDVSLAEVAQECGISAGHFSRAFRQSFGTTPHRWLERHRLDAAKKLLLHSCQSLEEIAVACGFTDAPALVRTFRRVIGTTPGQWRRSRSESSS